MKKLLAIFLLFTAAFAGARTIEQCMEEGNILFKDNRLEDAKTVFLDCSKLDAENTDIMISVAGIFLLQNNLTQAKDYFEKALKLLPENSRYNSYVYSRLGDIYFRVNNLPKAKKNYQESLKYNRANVNSIIGEGVISEKEGKLKDAAKAYKTALAVEPYNPIARENYRRLEPEIFSDKEILNALIIRKAVADDKETVTEEDRTLFLKIHRAEQSMGVEYLQDKYKGRAPEGMIIETGAGTPELRFMLSLKGYQEVMRIMSIEASRYFMDAGVNTSDVYRLRALNGMPVFDDKGVLTEEGIAVYKAALEGRKEFVLPSEPIPADREKEAAQVQALISAGYVEVTAKEFEYIKSKTLCSENTLAKDLGVKGVNVIRPRYFIEGPGRLVPAPANPKEIMYAVLLQFRGQTQNSYSSFFGRGGFGAICDKQKGSLLSLYQR